MTHTYRSFFDCIRLKIRSHLEERLLDQAQVRASYTPLFLGSFA